MNDVLFVDDTSVLRKVIREARKLYYKDLLETPENKVKATWHIFSNVTGMAGNSKHMPPLFKLDYKKALLENTSEVLITIVLNINGNPKIQVDNDSLPISLLKNAYANAISWMNVIPVTGEIRNIICSVTSKNTSGYDGMSTKILKWNNNVCNKILTLAHN